MSGFGIHGKRIDSSTSRLNAAQDSPWQWSRKESTPGEIEETVRIYDSRFSQIESLPLFCHCEPRDSLVILSSGRASLPFAIT